MSHEKFVEWLSGFLTLREELSSDQVNYLRYKLQEVGNADLKDSIILRLNAASEEDWQYLLTKLSPDSDQYRCGLRWLFLAEDICKLTKNNTSASKSEPSPL
jgi:hypothetical protein